MMLLKLILLPFWYLSYLFPRKKNLWVFGCNIGNSFSDNTRYFFEYIHSNHPEIGAVWITNSDAIYQKLKSEGFQVEKKNSWRAKWICLRAGKGFTTHGKNDLCNEFTNGIVLYNLWHGMPIKTIGNIPPASILKRWFYKIWYPQKWNHFFITSEKFRPVMNNYYINSYQPIRQLSKMGMPRYDGYIKEGSEKIIDSYRTKFGKEVRFILYCPTYREQNEFAAYAEYGPIDIFENYQFDSGKLQALMEQLNAVFLVKMHPMANDDMNSSSNQNRVKLVEGSELNDIYYLLKDIDVLLSDYSSLILDYLVLDRPIIHTVFDFELYKKIRTFNFDYSDIVSGSMVKDWPETLQAIEESLVKDSFKKERKGVNELINDFDPNGSNCKQLFEFCTKT